MTTTKKAITRDANFIIELGEALYGRGWQRRMASETGFSQATFSKVATGKGSISAELRRALEYMVVREWDALLARRMTIEIALARLRDENFDVHALADIAASTVVMKKKGDAGGGGA